MSLELTELQQKVLTYIAANRTARYRDIMTAVGVNGIGSVQAVIGALAKKGYIAPRRRPGVWVVYGLNKTEGQEQ
jgi:predicted transcriptional regulator